MYIGPDKNIRQMQEEISAKALVKLLNAMYPGRNFIHRKSGGTISCDFRRVDRVLVTPDNSSVELNISILGDLGFPFDKEEVKRRWNVVAKGGAATWSF